MPDKIFHSSKLDLDYKIKYDNQNRKVIVFEDNINYTSYERDKIKDCSDMALKNIHNIKLLFNGVII
jgi:hypothetical protein